MARKIEKRPLPDDIAAMDRSQVISERQRMKDSGQFENAIRERDYWQGVANDFLARKSALDQREIEILEAQEEGK